MKSEQSHVLRIHGRVCRSLANGPGARAVIWLQGCSTRCPGCFNRHLWDPRGGTEIAVDTLVEWAAGLAHVEGISVSGGEPTDQLPALVRFFQGLRRRTDLSILLFTGRGMDGIRAMPRGEMLLRLPDVLIDGPYDAGYANAPGVWPSSTNQTLHLLTDRYDLSRFQGLPEMEVLLTPNGDIIISGIGAWTSASPETATAKE